MRTDLTDITLVLDRSGSMASIREETQNGVQKFIDDQKKVPGAAVLSLVLFDERIERPFTAKPLVEAPAVVLDPRGSTALFDAIGTAIDATGKRLEQMPEAERPGRVIVVIVTDGYENASRQYAMPRISEMIAKQTDTYKWDFVFLGANQDAIATAANMNIGAGAAISYAASAAGTAAVYDSLSTNLRSARITGQSTNAVGFTDKQRKASLGNTGTGSN